MNVNIYNIQPTLNRVLVKVCKEEWEKTKGGILLAKSQDKLAALSGTVVTCGPDVKNIKSGSVVIFSEVEAEKMPSIESREEAYIIEEDKILGLLID